MKKMMCVGAILTFFMLFLPIGALSDSSDEVNLPSKSSQSVTNTDKTYEEELNDTFNVLDKSTGKITKMSAEEYIFGVVAAEMPALYEEEALKAQAVAAYTYACYKREGNKGKEYDITTDYSTDQSFKTEAQAIKDWGSNADEYVKKIKAAVSSVKGEKITYNGKPILAVYHSVSSGQTFDVKDVWGGDYPYLKSASSAWDKLAKNYTKTYEATTDELKEKLADYITEDKKSDYLLDNFKSQDNGLVISCEVYGNEISGSELREALELASTCFKYEKSGEVYKFTSYGYGHGVGMSQHGADYLAEIGYSYKEILSHYYKNTEIIC